MPVKPIPTGVHNIKLNIADGYNKSLPTTGGAVLGDGTDDPLIDKSCNLSVAEANLYQNFP